jgi:hypothetical protein
MKQNIHPHIEPRSIMVTLFLQSPIHLHDIVIEMRHNVKPVVQGHSQCRNCIALDDRMINESEDRRNRLLRNVSVLLHDVIFQKILSFMVTAVKTSNPAW